MPNRLRLRRVLSLCAVLVLLGSPAGAQNQTRAESLADVRQSFKEPPDDCRIMMRWWWFGPSVAKDELERELKLMKAGGIGGVEVQATYPLALDDTGSGTRNYAFLSDEYLENLRFAAEKARELGMRFDVTLGSGWPYGGPSVAIAHAAGMLRVNATPVATGENSVALPSMEEGEEYIAAFLVREAQGNILSEGAQRLSEIQNGRLILPPIEGPHEVLFFIASRTGQQVKRPAIGAEGFVLDHYDRSSVEDYLHAVGDRMMEAFGSHPPYAVFSDSLEVYGSNWAGDFLKEFRERRGYDLTQYLPELVGKDSASASEVRHDWGQTLTELADENYLARTREWAARHGTLFRSQTYGIPPVTLSSNALVDLPEGEGWNWQGFSAVRWAASASHLYGRQVTSSETWTWLHSPVFRATPLDMKAAADAYFLEGSNQLIGHGWPYSPKSAGEPGWHFYAAAAFNEHNPWWFAMPNVTRYLQRVSYILRQGKPIADVALLLPSDDAWAQFSVAVTGLSVRKGEAPAPGTSASVNEVLASRLGTRIIPEILESGYSFDFIDAEAIDKIGIHYPVLVLPGIKRLPLNTYRKIEAYARAGGIVIATRDVPSTAPGLKPSETESPEVARISQQLFRDPAPRGYFVAKDTELGAKLRELIKPDVVFSPASPGLGFVHRKLPSEDVYFVANTTNQMISTQAAFRVTANRAEVWDPVSGKTHTLRTGSALDLALQPYESSVVVFSEQDVATKPRERRKAMPTTLPQALDLSTGWSLTFAGSGVSRTMKMERLRSWTEDANTKYYSGIVSYEKTAGVTAAMLNPAFELYLDFGSGTPVVAPASRQGAEGTGSSALRMQAWLDSPVREAAQVFVNGQSAGAIWLPPYEIDVTKYVHAGQNEFKIMVGNLAINEMAGRAAPDHRLLYDRYGVRFHDQDLEHLQPLPSGILAEVKLVARNAKTAQ